MKGGGRREGGREVKEGNASEEGGWGLVMGLDMEINSGKITWALIILLIRPKMARGKKGNCI